MGSYRQTLLYDLPTLVTLLAGETRVHSYDLMPSTCSLCTENSEKRAPTGIHDGFREMVIFDHMTDSQVFYHNALIALGIGPGCLEMVISPLSIDLEMSLCYVLSSLTAPLTAFLAPGQLTLLASQGLLRGTIEARVRNGVALAIRQERLQPYINANSSMGADAGKMCALWLCLADDQRIPMPISPQDKMYSLGRTLYLAMQLDLEEMSQLLRHDEVFLILVQVTVFAVLSKLNRVPLIAFLEAWEAYFQSKLFAGKKAFERLGETVSEHLYCCGRYMLTTSPGKSPGQIILAGECAFLLILCFRDRKHLVIKDARLTQALHEQGMLLCIDEKAILKRFHTSSYIGLESVCQQFRPPAGGGHSLPCLKAGTLWPIKVGKQSIHNRRIYDAKVYNYP
jgi:hypothetical protein